MPPPTIYSREWENVTAWLKRMKLPGGWLICYFENTGDRPAICFVADPNYSWVLG